MNKWLCVNHHIQGSSDKQFATIQLFVHGIPFICGKWTDKW